MTEIGTPSLEYILSVIPAGWPLSCHTWDPKSEFGEYNDGRYQALFGVERRTPYDVNVALNASGRIGGLALSTCLRAHGGKATWEFIPCFDAAEDAELDDVVDFVVNVLKLKGVVVDTGASYHFIADRVVSGPKKRLTDFKALLRQSLVVDQAWVDFTDIRDAMVLRTTRAPERPEPRVVRVIA